MSNPQRVGVNTNVKQFNNDIVNSALWIFNKISNTITPGNKKANVLINGNLTVIGSINSPSDFSLKENIQAISHEECNDVLNLKGVKFNYTNDNDKKEHYGLIAQEVESYFPELVNEITTHDKVIKTVNYLELLPIMLCKIEKMQKEITRHEQHIEIVKSDFSSLIRKITMLEQKINNLNNEIVDLKRK